MQSVLILGASGMLGHSLLTRLVRSGRYEVRATARKIDPLVGHLSPEVLRHVTGGIDADNFDSIIKIIGDFKPDCVINCIGIIKQLSASTEHIPALTINALFPHRLAMLCKAACIRLIHISTDCVFDGLRGSYTEKDPSNASDLYGRTKFLGELDYSHCVTLRTSIIGHELGTRYGLIEWFLAQEKQVQGFTRAIFSGFPTVELSDLIMDHVLFNPRLQGLYHVSSEPISKHDLLMLVARQYHRPVEIVPQSSFHADRSLLSSRFRDATGYTPPSWPVLVERMHAEYLESLRSSERKER